MFINKSADTLTCAMLPRQESILNASLFLAHLTKRNKNHFCFLGYNWKIGVMSLLKGSSCARIEDREIMEKAKGVQ